MKFASLVGVLSITLVVPFAQADEKATTRQLPDALQALDVGDTQLLTEQQAGSVRGAGGGALAFSQIKQFVIVDGAAQGTTTLLEGVFGQFQYINDNGLQVAGTFGGLEGGIGVHSGDLEFYFAGKAFQETVEFIGPFSQQFLQSFEK